MLAAARRGVDVRVLIPEVSNHVLADWVARSFYERLLRGGVSIWLYQSAMVHAKTATVDGRWTTIGTTNIDRMRSEERRVGKECRGQRAAQQSCERRGQ